MSTGPMQIADGNNTPSISIIAGSLDERENIIEFIHQVFTSVEGDYATELIIVDDGSTDGTRELLTAEAAHDDRIIPIFNSKRKGLLESHFQGISSATGDYKIVMDSDLQHPPQKIPKIIDMLVKGHDIVICSRYVSGGSVGRRNGLRGTISRTATFFGKIALRGRVTVMDNVSGYFGFRKQIRMPELSFTSGFKALLYILAENPYAKVVEIPYVFQKRGYGDSKIVTSWKFMPKFLFEAVNVAKVSSMARKAQKKWSGEPRTRSEYTELVTYEEQPNKGEFSHP